MLLWMETLEQLLAYIGRHNGATMKPQRIFLLLRTL